MSGSEDGAQKEMEKSKVGEGDLPCLSPAYFERKSQLKRGWAAKKGKKKNVLSPLGTWRP